jgi:hypothetical protein
MRPPNTTGAPLKLWVSSPEPPDSPISMPCPLWGTAGPCQLGSPAMLKLSRSEAMPVVRSMASMSCWANALLQASAASKASNSLTATSLGL